MCCSAASPGSDGAVDLLSLDKASFKKARREVQMIFQDPYSSLNPRMTIQEILARPLRHSRRQDVASETQERVVALLEH